MNNRLGNELARMADVYRGNLALDIDNSNANFHEKELANAIMNNTHDVLIAFANEIAKETNISDGTQL